MIKLYRESNGVIVTLGLCPRFSPAKEGRKKKRTVSFTEGRRRLSRWLDKASEYWISTTAFDKEGRKMATLRLFIHFPPLRFSQYSNIQDGARLWRRKWGVGGAKCPICALTLTPRVSGSGGRNDRDGAGLFNRGEAGPGRWIPNPG